MQHMQLVLNLIERKYTFEDLPKRRKFGIDNDYDREKILFENKCEIHNLKIRGNI